MTTSRRDFLKFALAAAAGSCRVPAALGTLGSTLAAIPAQAAAGDYRALVCVYLAGGNDGFNTLVRTDAEGYAAYARRRSGMALPSASLLRLTPSAGGVSYGLHSALQGFQSLYNQGQLAFVSNVGTLLAPTTLSDYRAGRNLPPQLFSHIDQASQWSSTQPDSLTKTGWGAKLAELLPGAGGQMPMNISLDRIGSFQMGGTASPYVANSRRLARVAGVVNGPTTPRAQAYASLIEMAGADASPIVNSQAATSRRAVDISAQLNAAATSAPILTTIFPDDAFGRSLAMIAKLISIRDQVGARRQTFYVELGGFDTHDDQLDSHAALLQQLSAGLSAFASALNELAVFDQVTTFSMSDFGRTLVPNNDGTDHAWGNNQFVMGGAVAGGRVLGTFPNLSEGSPDDVRSGRLIPTTSVEQYGAQLSRWMGVQDSGLRTIFPHLDRFSSAGLDLMKV